MTATGLALLSLSFGQVALAVLFALHMKWWHRD